MTANPISNQSLLARRSICSWAKNRFSVCPFCIWLYEYPTEKHKFPNEGSAEYLRLKLQFSNSLLNASRSQQRCSSVSWTVHLKPISSRRSIWSGVRLSVKRRLYNVVKMTPHILRCNILQSVWNSISIGWTTSQRPSFPLQSWSFIKLEVTVRLKFKWVGLK